MSCGSPNTTDFELFSGLNLGRKGKSIGIERQMTIEGCRG